MTYRLVAGTLLALSALSVSAATVSVQPADAAGTGPYAYVIAGSPSGTLTALEVPGPTVSSTVSVGNYPAGVAVTPDGDTVWVAAGGPSGTVTPIDAATGLAGTPIAVGLNPGGFAITPDGQALLVGVPAITELPHPRSLKFPTLSR